MLRRNMWVWGTTSFSLALDLSRDSTLTPSCLSALDVPLAFSPLGKSLYSFSSLGPACRKENLLSDTVTVLFLRGFSFQSHVCKCFAYPACSFQLWRSSMYPR